LPAAAPAPMSAAATPAPMSAPATPAPMSAKAAAAPAPVSAAATPAPVLHLIHGIDDGGSIIDHCTVYRRGRSGRCTGHTHTRGAKPCNHAGSHSSSPSLLLSVRSLPSHTRNHHECVLG